MAELTDTTDIRETVREKYAAAARAAGARSQARASDSGSGCCGSPTGCCSPGDEAGVFGASLYDEAVRDSVPEAALTASLGLASRRPSPTCTRGRPCSTSGRAPVRTC
jgi:hypothetical protein